MRILKIIGIALLVALGVITTLFTIYFLFAGNAYGIEVLKETFADGFGAGIKTFFIDIWNGIKFVIK